MKMILGIVLSIAALSVKADECTSLVEGYLEGLKTGATLTAANEAEKKNAQDLLEDINKIREHKEDCFIVETTPALKASRDALEHAVNSSEPK